MESFAKQTIKDQANKMSNGGVAVMRLNALLEPDQGKIKYLRNPPFYELAQLYELH